MDLFEKVSKDIVAAMKAKDKVRLEALRNIKKYFIEAKTQPGANDTLTDEAALKILSKLAKQGRDTAALYVSQNREDLAAEEAAQAAVIEEYLPKALTPEEVEAEVKAIIAEVGATSPKDMGNLMFSGIASVVVGKITTEDEIMLHMSGIPQVYADGTQGRIYAKIAPSATADYGELYLATNVPQSAITNLSITMKKII